MSTLLAAALLLLALSAPARAGQRVALVIGNGGDVAAPGDAAGPAPEPPPLLVAGAFTSPPPAALRPGDTWTEPATGMEFAWVPGGCFRMGSRSGRAGERPVHEVCVDGLWVGKYEVTQGQWVQVMGSNPSGFPKGAGYPVETVSWNDAQDFIRKLNARGNGTFRLPTEAEWEYAARSGGRVETYAGGQDVDRVAWYAGNGGGAVHPVGTLAPNGLGLYDMSGNVFEWCGDWYAGDAYAGHARNNPLCSAGDRDARVLRGGGWSSDPASVRAAYRLWGTPGARANDVGFRLVRLPRE